MNGEIAYTIAAALWGDGKSLHVMKEIFGDDFQAWTGWWAVLERITTVRTMVRRPADFWSRTTFQDLFICCWIHHPLEKGSYMLQLPSDSKVREGYNKLVGDGALQLRRSSHLSAVGRADAAASAHEDWAFLRGYEELLIQIETQAGAEYLFLKAEGHPCAGVVSTIQHGISYIEQQQTGKGKLANETLNQLATSSPQLVEGRAAENFSPEYKKLLEQLGFTAKTTPVALVVNKLSWKASQPMLKAELMTNTLLLGAAMKGYLDKIWKNRDILKHNGIDFTAEVMMTLLQIGQRMERQGVAFTAQNFNEVRATPEQVDASLANFISISTSGGFKARA